MSWSGLPRTFLVKAGKKQKKGKTEIGDEKSWKKPGKVELVGRRNKIVGFEDELETIIGYLKEERDELDVICIVGMPGQGKTTLAQEIFQVKTIDECRFHTRIWVNASREFDLRCVLSQIIQGISNDLHVFDNTTDEHLAQAVRAYLEGDKFLLVIDEVCTVKAWRALHKVFPKGNKGSKVVITTRNMNVGTHANVTRKPLNLRFLTPEESWKLLQYQVFGELDNCPDELKGIGKCIAEQCCGQPLAIKVIGGILMDDFSTIAEMSAIHNAWSQVSKDMRRF